MKPTPIAAAIEEIRDRLSALDAERDRLTIALTTLESVAGVGEGHRVGKASRIASPRKTASKAPSPKALGKARRIAATKGLGVAAKVTGIPYGMLWRRAKKEKWTLAKGEAAKPAEAKASAAAPKEG